MTSSARWLHQLSAIVPAQKWVRGVKLDEREDSGRKEANQESCLTASLSGMLCALVVPTHFQEETEPGKVWRRVMKAVKGMEPLKATTRDKTLQPRKGTSGVMQD